MGLELATSSTDARETSYASSSSNSEILSGDDRSDTAESDDVHSIRSFTEGSSPSVSFRGPPWVYSEDSTVKISRFPAALTADAVSKVGQSGRGRVPSRLTEKYIEIPSSDHVKFTKGSPLSPRRIEPSRRSSSGPPRTCNGLARSASTPMALITPLPPSPIFTSYPDHETSIFYETAGPKFAVIYPGSHSSIFSQYQQHQHLTSPISSCQPSLAVPQPLATRPHDSHIAEAVSVDRSSAGPNTPTPASYSSHSHSCSTVTITALTPPPHISKFAQRVTHSSPLISNSRSSSPPIISTKQHTHSDPPMGESTSPRASTSNGSSPTPSSIGYASSLSRSPSLSPPPSSKSPIISPHVKLDSPTLATALLPLPSCQSVTIASPRTPHIVSLNDVVEDKVTGHTGLTFSE
jgi:terminal uridylyltransferase